MPPQNYRTPASASVASGRVRALWQNFVKTSSGRRNATEHKIRAATDKVDEEAKAAITKDIREKHCLTLRSQWQTLLHKEGLNGAQWIDKTEEERDAVTRILGEFEDEEEVTAPSLISPPMAQAKLPSYAHPLAPSISSSTRSTNISSASSYAFVSPSELCSEDDQDEFFNPLMPTSNDTSDDDEAMIQPIQFHPGRRGGAQNGWSSSESLSASLQGSVGSSSEIPFSRPLASGFAQNIPYGRMSSAKQSAASHQSENAPAPKSKVVRQPYIGPRLEDRNETISEAEDFERFKMQTRMEKIVEFHQAAALAEIRLSFAIYRSRKAQDGERLEVSPLVLEHQKSMVQLQTAKEDERKAIVKTERSKRRSELRGRPGRSNTLMAPTPSVPLSTNPSWLNGIEGQLSSQLEPQFDINKLLSEDPDEQENSMQRMFGQIFPEPSSSFDNRSSISANSFRGHEFSSQSAFQSGQGSSSASMQSGVPGRGGHSSQTYKRRPSDARMKNVKKGKGPSLFGENDSGDDEVESDEGDDDVDDNERPPAARNPFMNAQASDMSPEQWSIDFELQRTMAQYGLSPEPTPATTQSWGSSSRLMEQPPSAPTPSPWMTSAAAKEVRSTATPVSSGWTRRNSVVPPPQPTYAPAPSFRNPFGESEPSPPPPPPSTMPTMTSAKAKGKQPMNANTPVETQPIWGQPHKKPSPSIPAAPTDVFVASVAPVAVPTPVPPQVEKPTTPAPSQTPASASKKLNKKQRQAAKKGGPAVASSFVEESESTPSHVSPITQSVDSAVEEDPSYVTEPNPEPSMFSSPLSRMLPSMPRAKTDQAAGMNGFSSWDTADPVSTPRPPSKIPTHVQEALLAASEGTPRPNQSKKNPLAELLSIPLNKTAAEHLAATSTIRAPQWGSAAATNAPTKSLWNMFNSEPATVPKLAQQPAGDPQVPGGFGWNAEGGDEDLGDDDGGGGDEVETMSQSFWQPPKSTGAPINLKSTSVPAQKTAVAAQGLRRMSEAPSSALPPPAPPAPAKVVTPVIQPQPVPASANKKGKGKKGKGKKVTIEEVPDDDADKNIDHLPVDSKIIFEPSNSSNDTPNHYDLIRSFGDEDDVLLSTPSSFAATPSTAASSPPDLFGGAQAWLPTASTKETANIGWGAAKPVAWNPGVGTETESQTPLWGRALQPKQQQTPVWGQTSNKDKGKGKQTDLEQGSKVVNPAVQNLKRSKPTAGGKLL